MKAVSLLSGGLDSTTLAYQVLKGGNQGYIHELTLLSFNYGQRHAVELEHAAAIAETAKQQFPTTRIKHEIVDMSFMAGLLNSSALTNPDQEVPEGHYAEENMKATVVPNRNAIMLSIAYGVAIAQGATCVYAGMHAGDHPIYPDCRPEFILALNRALDRGNEGYAPPGLHIEAPFVNISKAEIVMAGARLGAPLQLTWSCYKGGEIHCGRCGTCVERKEAFRLAKVVDPTEYEDPEYMIPAMEQELIEGTEDNEPVGILDSETPEEQPNSSE